MPLDNKIHKKIIKEGKYIFEILAEYDRTREWPIGRAMLDITLSKKIIQKLKKIKEKTGNSISCIIEEAIDKLE